jgi:hypothetical protein
VGVPKQPGRCDRVYLSTGDGDLKVDLQNDAQRLDSLLGKILRIDVRARKLDTTAPNLGVTLGNDQRVLRNRSAVVFANCSEPCSVIASGRLRLGHGYDLPAWGSPRSLGGAVGSR